MEIPKKEKEHLDNMKIVLGNESFIKYRHNYLMRLVRGSR